MGDNIRATVSGNSSARLGSNSGAAMSGMLPASARKVETIEPRSPERYDVPGFLKNLPEEFFEKHKGEISERIHKSAKSDDEFGVAVEKQRKKYLKELSSLRGKDVLSRRKKILAIEIYGLFEKLGTEQELALTRIKDDAKFPDTYLFDRIYYSGDVHNDKYHPILYQFFGSSKHPNTIDEAQDVRDFISAFFDPSSMTTEFKDYIASKLLNFENSFNEYCEKNNLTGDKKTKKLYDKAVRSLQDSVVMFLCDKLSDKYVKIDGFIKDSVTPRAIRRFINTPEPENLSKFSTSMRQKLLSEVQGRKERFFDDLRAGNDRSAVAADATRET